MLTRHENYDLSAHNTFGLKVSCALYIEYDKAEDLFGLDFTSLPQPVRHIGGGSNLLFTGEYFPGTLLHSAIKYIKYVDVGLPDVPVMVGAGVIFDDFVENVSSNGLWGAENLSLIPGEVGAAAVQNIGAYGVEAADIISGVVCYDISERRKVSFKKAECAYGYRASRFKGADAGRYIVTSVLFRLSRQYSPKLDYGGVRAAFGGVPPQNPSEVRGVISDIRRAKLPDPAVIGSAGSFFKNPVLSREQYSAFLSRASVEAPHFDLPGGSVKVPAAWLIDSCGLKGATVGGAAVYEKQPLVIVNATGTATASDILSLEKHIVDTVFDRYGITLEPEVEHIGAADRKTIQRI